MYVCMHVWMDGWMYVWMDGWMEEPQTTATIQLLMNESRKALKVLLSNKP